MSTAAEFTVVMADPGYKGQPPKGPRTSIIPLTRAKALDFRRTRTNYFVFTSATELEPVAGLVHQANSSHRLRALFVRADVDCGWFLPMFERANLRTLRNTIVHTGPAIPDRVLSAWQIGAQNSLIADATVADDRLLVRSCALESFEIAFDAIPALSTIPRDERSRFDVDSDGSFLHWPAGDVHVGLDMIRSAIDPQFRDSIRAARLSSDLRFGEAVKAIRLAHGLRQKDIDGVSAKQIARIESGSGAPRYETLAKIAAAHGVSISDYLEHISAQLKSLPASADAG